MARLGLFDLYGPVAGKSLALMEPQENMEMKMKKLHRWDFFMQYKSFGVILLTVLYVALPGWSAAETKAPTPQAAKLAPVPPQPRRLT